MIYWYILVFIFLGSAIPIVYAQEVVIPVNQTQPCFLNYSAGSDLWQNCGVSDDYLTFALMPWEWVTGGYFSMIVVSLFVTISYIKYHKAVYPILIGIMFLPLSYFVFPPVFLTWAIIMAGITFGILIWYIYIKQTKEY